MPEPQISRGTLAQIPAPVKTPTYAVHPESTGVAHLGLGAFHRAHQAMVFDQLLREGDARWGIHGVGMTQPGLVDELRCTRCRVCGARCGRYRC
jgi:fructuronate reductase